MKTHQEIHDAIRKLCRDGYGGIESDAIKILHALNDRIKGVDGGVKAAFTAIEVLDSSKAPRE